MHSKKADSSIDPETLLSGSRSPSKPPAKFSLRSTRMYIALLLMFGIFTGTNLRIDMSMGIVCMVNSSYSDHARSAASLRGSTVSSIYSNLSTTPSTPNKCGQLTIEEATESGYDGELEWDQKQIAMLFSASFYGMLATVWWSGWVADKFSPKIIFFCCVCNSVFFTLLTPTLAKLNFWAIVAGRFWMGLGEGFIMPCITSIGANWFAPSERSTFAAIYTSGNQVGAALGMPISSLLCSSQWGWPSIFYTMGSLGVVWLTLWYLFAADTPDSSPFVSLIEKEYIHAALGKMARKRKDLKTPWRGMLTSVPFLAAIMAQLSFSFSAIFIQTYLPMYLKQVLKVNLKTNGLFSVLPFIAQIVTKNILSNVSDSLKKKKILSHTGAVKIFQLIGNVGCACCFLSLAFFVDCDTIPLAVVTLILFGCFVSCAIPGFFTALLSIAPPFTGTITSVSLTIGAIGHSTSPALVGFFNRNGTKEEWRVIWLVAVFLHVVAAIVFLTFGSAEMQEWSKIKEQTPIGEGGRLNGHKDDVEMVDAPDNLSIAE